MRGFVQLYAAQPHNAPALSAARPSHQGPQAGVHLFQGKGLDHVVVRSAVQTAYLIGHGIPRGEHEYGRGVAVLVAQAAAYGQAVQPGQHNIEQDDVKTSGPGPLQSGSAVVGAIQLIPQRFKKGIQIGHDIRIVLNNKRPYAFHASLLAPPG